ILAELLPDFGRKSNYGDSGSAREGLAARRVGVGQGRGQREEDKWQRANGRGQRRNARRETDRPCAARNEPTVPLGSRRVAAGDGGDEVVAARNEPTSAGTSARNE